MLANVSIYPFSDNKYQNYFYSHTYHSIGGQCDCIISGYALSIKQTEKGYQLKNPM